MASSATKLEQTLGGLDALDLAEPGSAPLGRRVWAALWPKLAAVTVALLLWQCVVWTKWRPEFTLPGPVTSFRSLQDLVVTGEFWKAVAITMKRAAIGYVLAVLIGSVIGAAVARTRLLRSAVGSLITGLQTMPSIAWFPLAILLFKLSESAILFVVVLGAAPSIANGLISGVDNIPPLWLRSGRMLGARGVNLYRYVILPAALPGFVSGLKQGWAFAWRSLMAGELIVIIANRPSIGQRLQFSRELSDTPGLIAWMIVVLVIGIVVDTLFGAAELSIRRRRGLVEAGG